MISQTNAQGVHTFGYDGLGSTRILTDVNGTVQNSYGYQAFGELDYQYGAIENNYLFTGEQYDNNVGFYYLRARYYNPGIGRFQNMDTFPGMQFEPLSLHKYLYTHADPVNNVDPTGHFSIGSLMTGLRVAAIQARYAVATLSRKVLNFVRKKKVYNIYVYQIIKPWHTYMYVEKDRKRSGTRYDVGIHQRLSWSELLASPFKTHSGYVRSWFSTRANLRGKRAKITKMTFLQRFLWHSTVVGRNQRSCNLDYNLVTGSNCTSWTIWAAAKALLISRLPI